MRIAFANDHAALDARDILLKHLAAGGHKVLDFGVILPDSVDYPDLAEEAARAVVEGNADCAVVVCGTGIGVSIAANKVRGIRCALCTDVYAAEKARSHNDANVIALRGREKDPAENIRILQTFLTTEFTGGRHQRRIDKITAIEHKNETGCISDEGTI